MKNIYALGTHTDAGTTEVGVQSKQVMAKIVILAPCRNTLDRLT